MAYKFNVFTGNFDEVGSGGSTPANQAFTTTGGAQTFTLSNTPTVIFGVVVNGQALNSTSGYTSSGTGVTLVDTLTPSGLSVNITYFY